MITILSGLSEPATTADRFASHITDTQRIFLCSKTKQEPLQKTLVSELPRYEFFQPSQAFCRFLVVDIDHVFALSYLNDLPKNIRPHAFVLTSKGLQAFWLIEGVPLTSNARTAPIRFARDVGELLRRACNADPAVDPVTPTKCRNPLSEDAETRYMVDAAPYMLKTLSEGLRKFLRGRKFVPELKVSSKPPTAIWGELSEGQRNETIFQTIRRVAYRGGDFEAMAYELNAKCSPPLPDSEVASIVRSVQKFMDTRFNPSEARREPGEPVPEAVREFMAEIGRKGGSRKTEKQKENLVKARNASSAVRSAQAIGRKAQIQELKKAGYKQREVAEKMNLGIATVKRSWN